MNKRKQLVKDLNIFPLKLKCIKTTLTESFIKGKTYSFIGEDRSSGEPKGTYIEDKDKKRYMSVTKKYIYSMIEEGYLK